MNSNKTFLTDGTLEKENRPQKKKNVSFLSSDRSDVFRVLKSGLATQLEKFWSSLK